MNGFSALGLLLALALGLVAAGYGASRVLAPPRDSVPSAPFLSGHEPTEHAFSRFHVRWYTLTMIFLAFDMEMLFMYPWVLVVSSVGPSAVIEMFTFLLVLLVAVAYAWREGALRWS